MEFDYVVVGAGSAGCVLAHRLTQDGSHKVLLLEAGGKDNKTEVKIPAAFSKMFRSDVDWAYQTAPQEHLGGRSLYWPRGKMLGGSSSINAMIYQRGHRLCYDAWAEAGNPGWSYEEVLPFFRKSENHGVVQDEYHGQSGPLHISALRSPNPLSEAFVEAAVELGYKRNADFSGMMQEGFGLYHVSQHKGQRWSVAHGYLHPALKRPNLQVKTHALATRLLFDGKTCTGVAYQQGGKTHEVKARREVLLCGGALNSPQLLMLSGVGAPAHLSEHGVDVVHALSGVGQGLQDHLFSALCYECKEPISLAGAESLINLGRYLLMRKGMLTSNVGEAGGFVSLREGATIPEMQYHFAPGYYLEHGFVQPEGHGFSIGPTLVRVKSRGSVSLASSAPEEAPVIQPNYFSEAEDLELMLEGFKLARQLGSTEAFTPYRKKEYLPGPDVRSDDELRAYLRECVESLYHPVGTCKMGPAEDDAAVVDPQLRVHGIDRLRVVDASIMPTIVNANTNMPTVMIAERAAAFLEGHQ